MKLIEYLDQRYPKKNYALTHEQATLLRMPYPLVAGWMKYYADVEVNPLEMDFLSAVEKRKRKQAKRKKRTTRKPSPMKVSFAATDKFLETFEWRQMRMKALKKYGARCQCCGRSAKDGAVICVDHIRPRKLYPDLALELDNLQVLCDLCNHGKGNWDMTDWRSHDTEDTTQER